MTIDGIWSAVGSSNFDDRSFETNDEITVGFVDPELAQQLEAVFEKYAAECSEISLEQWQKRSLWQRTKEHAYYLINEQPFAGLRERQAAETGSGAAQPQGGAQAGAARRPSARAEEEAACTGNRTRSPRSLSRAWQAIPALTFSPHRLPFRESGREEPRR